MLTGNDFIILSDTEVKLLYNALEITLEKATYKKLQKLGILNLVDNLKTFIFKKEDKQ